MCAGNKQCCVASQLSAPAGGKGRQCLPAPASMAQLGKSAAFPGSVGLSHECAAGSLASHLDPTCKHAGWLKVMRAGFVFPQHRVNEQSA